MTDRAQVRPSRRGLLALGSVLAAVAGLIAGRLASASAEPASRADARARLGRVRSWGCQYQRIEIAALAASDFDLVVIEPQSAAEPAALVARADVTRLKSKPDGGRRLVLAYLSIGEAARHRPYWTTDWDTAPPDFLGPVNPDWPGAHGVRYWREGWQRLLLEPERGMLPAILAQGFDGVFLDSVDAFQRWQGERPGAADDMVRLIERIGASARRIAPAALLIGQNAEPLLARADYRAAIDGVSKESLLTGLRGPGIANSAADIAWSRAGLEAAKDAGLPILAIEYLSEPQAIAQARGQLAAFGYVPFFASRLLDVLPGTSR